VGAGRQGPTQMGIRAPAMQEEGSIQAAPAATRSGGARIATQRSQVDRRGEAAARKSLGGVWFENGLKYGAWLLGEQERYLASAE